MLTCWLTVCLLQLESKRGSLLYMLLRLLGLAVFLPGEALIHWPHKLIYLEPMTVTLPSQKNVRDVKTLHLVADARISTCAVLTGKKTPSRNVRIYLRSAMCDVFGHLIERPDAVAAVYGLCNLHGTH